MNLKRIRDLLNEKNRSYILSFRYLRQLIGWLGISLPLVMLAGGLLAGNGIERSISAYYHTHMQDYFVGLMCAVSLFLISYHGYLVWDRLLNFLSGLAGLGVALFPTAAGDPFSIGLFGLPSKTSSFLHSLSAAVFFIVLAVVSIFFFTRTDGGGDQEKKRKRNWIYRICGTAMLAFVVLIGVFQLKALAAITEKAKMVFLFEGVALLAFGISWLVKGEGILKDRPVHTRQTPPANLHTEDKSKEDMIE